jgi:transposase
MEEGLSIREVARRLGCNASSVQRWLAAERRVRADGEEARRPGRPGYLSEGARSRLRERLKEPPRRRGIAEDGWTTELVGEQLRLLTRYSYTRGTIEKIVRALGFIRGPRRRGPDGSVRLGYWVPRRKRGGG